MINGICGGGEDARSESVLIEGCTMSGIRGHAIQLYKLRMNVTVKDCKINSWGSIMHGKVDGSGVNTDGSRSAGIY